MKLGHSIFEMAGLIERAMMTDEYFKLSGKQDLLEVVIGGEGFIPVKAVPGEVLERVGAGEYSEADRNIGRMSGHSKKPHFTSETIPQIVLLVTYQNDRPIRFTTRYIEG